MTFTKTLFDTEYGAFDLWAFDGLDANKNACPIALSVGDLKQKKPVNLRVHSSCITGETLHSTHCDCREQLEFCMKLVAREGGVIIYLQQEGRGIGLYNKIKAYKLQKERGVSTFEADKLLGFSGDDRDYSVVSVICNIMEISAVKLITNNTSKIAKVASDTLHVVGRIPIFMPPKIGNKGYLSAQKAERGYLLPRYEATK
ncbi:GTP cyclohydrolase II RibA [Rhizobium rhizogenes]|uniref:GTP cyclohydrolase II RibA n=1 Tax=Rhizobium rhizogenes TaxID=359 RepID=UPI0024BDBFAA|nr:GTP cyclohydrolase II RibA [Rhizobium rhizogenes]MDJ1638180.1 GTP cyclohydrolase II RibA [Rhizobium rhizogenes]